MSGTDPEIAEKLVYVPAVPDAVPKPIVYSRLVFGVTVTPTYS